MLFALFKIKEIPQYSVLSELAFVLDKDNLLNLCEYFGGLTIKIPTIKELELILYALILYQYINIENKTMKEALELIDNPSGINLYELKNTYYKLCELMSQYSFGNE